MFHRPRLIPCLLLSDGNLVKTRKFKDPTYLGDPINAVKIFSEKGVDELCVQDIGASRKGGAPDFELLEEIAAEAFMPMSYGGGVTTMEQIHRLFHIGFEKVVLNTAFWENPGLIEQAAGRYGSQSVTVSIDVRQDLLHRYHCVAKDGTLAVPGTPAEAARRAQELGAGEILLSSVDRDGTMQGYDLKLIRTVAGVLNVPLIASGGASCAADMAKALHEGGAQAAAAGSMYVFWGPRRAVLIHAPEEKELYECGVYRDD